MKYLFSVVLVAVTFLFVGCGEAPRPAMNPNWPIKIDKSISNYIEVTNSISRKRSDNLSEVQFSLKNLMEHSSLDVLYQVQWFDRDGFRIKSITDTFRKIHLEPMAEKSFRVISTSPKVLTYKIIIVDYEKNKKRIPHEEDNRYN